MKYRFGSYCWTCKLWVLTGFFCLLALLISLGLWQLDRGEQKLALLEQQALAQNSAEITINDAMIYDQGLRYTRVTLAGQYDQDRQFLIDNQVRNRRAGYFVITPFLIENQQIAILINRGWLPASYDRTLLPDLSISKTKTTITGRINNFPSVGIKLSGAEIPGAGWPSVVQVVDSQQLANKLKYPVHNFQMLLDDTMVDGYQRSWKLAKMKMTPEKHTAYALQWFSFSLILTVMFVVLTMKKVVNESATKT